MQSNSEFASEFLFEIWTWVKNTKCLGVCFELKSEVTFRVSGRRWTRRTVVGSSAVWGDVWSFATTEYVRSLCSGIFRGWWSEIVSPYTVLSWNNKLAWSWWSLWISLMNVLCLNSGSICVILSCLMDSFHRSRAAALSFNVCACLAADLLHGNIFLRGARRLISRLDPSLAAFFASSSALSFPMIPIWLSVHLTSRSKFLCLLLSGSHQVMLLSPDPSGPRYASSQLHSCKYIYGR